MEIKKFLIVKLNRCLKRLMDVLFSVVLLAILSPLFVYLFYKISRDGGSAVYSHERIGMHGKKFQCHKFRSMIINSQEVLEHLLATDPEAKAEWNKDFKLKNDPRITPIGQFLRRTSIDELPQLWNVLKGDMSLVGPRPVTESELERYRQYAKYYLSVRPGMTGLWQVSGRNDTTYNERIRLDIRYILSWSLWKDFMILFRTISVVFASKGAY
ncbi:sugar transferase [Orbaceae bacterium ESL0727]|nr:sugar transferase [Orbaceae bacterium ESL0727]